MELNAWKTGVEKHIPALQVFLKNILLRKCDVELQEVNSGTTEETVIELKESAVVVRAVEENFETEILMGFSGGWVPLLTKVILNNANETRHSEITRDLFEEFFRYWLEVVQDSLKEVGVEVTIASTDVIRPGQLQRSLNLTKYLTASLKVEQKFDMEGDTQDGPLDLTIAMAHPNQDHVEMLEVAFTEHNPFLTDEYTEVSSQRAANIDFKRVEQEEEPADGEERQNKINVKGKTVEFENFDKSSAVKNSREVRNINMLKNVEMNLSVELGRREMSLGKILKLVKGSVIELEKLAGEPVEILVNGHKIAQGDVVVIDEHFGVRISNLLATQEHLKELG